MGYEVISAGETDLPKLFVVVSRTCDVLHGRAWYCVVGGDACTVLLAWKEDLDARDFIKKLA